MLLGIPFYATGKCIRAHPRDAKRQKWSMVVKNSWLDLDLND
jgi:hypothetical protein